MTTYYGSVSILFADNDVEHYFKRLSGRLPAGDAPKTLYRKSADAKAHMDSLNLWQAGGINANGSANVSMCPWVESVSPGELNDPDNETDFAPDRIYVHLSHDCKGDPDAAVSVTVSGDMAPLITVETPRWSVDGATHGQEIEVPLTYDLEPPILPSEWSHSVVISVNGSKLWSFDTHDKHYVDVDGVAPNEDIQYFYYTLDASDW
jgi:hypothetical protein